MPSGLIANLGAFWDDVEKAKVILIVHKDTTAWPACLAELDVRLVSKDGFVRNSETIQVDLMNGVTK